MTWYMHGKLKRIGQEKTMSKFPHWTNNSNGSPSFFNQDDVDGSEIIAEVEEMQEEAFGFGASYVGDANKKKLPVYNLYKEVGKFGNYEYIGRWFENQDRSKAAIRDEFGLGNYKWRTIDMNSSYGQNVLAVEMITIDNTQSENSPWSASNPPPFLQPKSKNYVNGNIFKSNENEESSVESSAPEEQEITSTVGVKKRKLNF